MIRVQILPARFSSNVSLILCRTFQGAVSPFCLRRSASALTLAAADDILAIAKTLPRAVTHDI